MTTRFSLHYRGKLPSNGKAKKKHELRLTLHDQLRAITERSQVGRQLLDPLVPGQLWPNSQLSGADDDCLLLERCDRTFLPLASKTLRKHFKVIDLAVGPYLDAAEPKAPRVELDIALYRPGAPGGIFHGSGVDIDNRLKTLFDALQPPAANHALGNPTPTEPEPICCLLVDDQQITRVNVETHELLAPAGPDEVVLVIGCRLDDCGILDVPNVHQRMLQDRQ